MATQTFPLQEQLIDAVIAFANAKLTSPTQAVSFFGGSWTPSDTPQLSECRRIQTEVRKWLVDPWAKGSAPHVPMIRGIRLTGTWGFQAARDDDVNADVKYEVTWDWHVASDVTLRAICGLAVVTAFQAGFRDWIGLCAREGCSTYFVDRDSRGIRRKYCKTEECEKALNRERVDAYRARQTKRSRN